MSEGKVNVKLGFRIAGLVLICASVVFCLILLFNGASKDALNYCNIVTLLLSDAAAAYYIIKGCRKEEQLFYMLFIIILAVNALVAVGNDAYAYRDPLRMIIATVIFGSALVIATSENLGKFWSYFFAGVFIASNVAYAVALINLENPVFLFCTIARAFMAVVLFALITFKYMDKKARKGE